MLRRKPVPAQNKPDVEVIFADGKMVTVPADVYSLVHEAMGKAVAAYRFEQERRWFEPKPNQDDYTQGFYAGRLYERKRITDLIQEGKNEE